MNMNEPFSEVKWESAPCDFCGEEEARFLFEGPDRLHKFPGLFRVIQCKNCGCIRQNPRPTRGTISIYYPDDYEPYIRAIEDESSILRSWDRRYGMIKRRRAISWCQGSGRVLDVGCATGVFLNEMKRDGWEVYGIEPNRRAATYAIQRFGMNVHIGTLQDVCFLENYFDVVTLWNVLEHLHSPCADLMRVRDLLKDDGWLVFSIPNLESLEAKIFGPLWLGWDLPRHLYFFPRDMLVARLAELGFYVESMRSLAGNYHASLISLQFLLEDKVPALASWPRWLLRAGHAMPVRMVAAPFFWTLGQAKLTSIITIFARKQPFR